MKVKELIAKLQKVPEDADVALYSEDSEGMPVECSTVLFIHNKSNQAIINSKNEQKLCESGYVLLGDYYLINTHH